MQQPRSAESPSVVRDLIAGVVVFLVALPLCLGIALASGAPLFAGLVSGVVGGIIVGVISGSHTSVSGPAAGLTAVVAAQITGLGSFETFLLAVVLAGVVQVLMGVFRAGFLAEFFPSSVIKGLLAAIGLILILKQVPHLLGHDKDPEGEMSFVQPDDANTFTELINVVGDLHTGAIVVGLCSLALLILWDRWGVLRRSPVPGSLAAVVLGVGLSEFLRGFGAPWRIGSRHLVQVPETSSLSELAGYLSAPDWSQLASPEVYLAGVTIALVASLETLLNIEAVDRIDPLKRTTPPSRELVAQGIGNMFCGLLGGLPITSVIIRSSVNINAGGRSRASAIFHGFLLAGCVGLVPGLLNRIPLSCLAAILLMTGYKLASPKLFRKMWREGYSQFLPFTATVLAILFTDLLIGIIVGLLVAITFILHSNLRRPLHKIVERHVGGEVLRIELANQVSFLNRAALARALATAPRGTHVLIDASKSDYIDPDILDLISDFRDEAAEVHGVELSLTGFQEKYSIQDRIQYVDYASRELRETLTPQKVLKILQDGNERFRTGKQLTRNLTRQLDATASGQFPLAVLLTCIDSRSPAELLFDLGLGDIFVVRIAGNFANEKVLGSMEFACAVAGAKLVLVLGHTRCGAVNAALDLHFKRSTALEATGCEHLDIVINEIQKSIHDVRPPLQPPANDKQREADSDRLAHANVLRTIQTIRSQSKTLAELEQVGKIAIVGAIYEVQTGDVHWTELKASGTTD